MASWFRGLPVWHKAIISLTGGLIIGSVTYLLLHRRDKKKTVSDSEAGCDGEKPKLSCRIVVLGLTGAGKSTLLVRSRGQKDISEITPTQGFNVIVHETSAITLNIWEIGGSDKSKPYWPNFLHGTDVLVFVVDSSDEQRITDAELEFHKLLDEDCLKGVPVLLLANKQDLPGAKSPFDIEKQFGCVKGSIKGRLMRTLGTVAAMHLPPHPSVWEAERLMISMGAKKRAAPC